MPTYLAQPRPDVTAFASHVVTGVGGVVVDLQHQIPGGAGDIFPSAIAAQLSIPNLATGLPTIGIGLSVGLATVAGVLGDLGTVSISGSLFNHEGTVLTKGRLSIAPPTFRTIGTQFMSANVVTITVPISGHLAFALAPGTYTVTFDPDPADTVTPLGLKRGYFKTVWSVPVSGPITLGAL